MTPRNIWMMIATISLASLLLASFSTVMVLLPSNTASQNLLSECANAAQNNISRNATDVPAPLPVSVTPTNRTFYLETSDVCGEIESGASYQYWTFNGTIPGPMLRVRVGDNVTIILHNKSAAMVHSIDLHAVIGPGGGMMLSQTQPGATTKFWFNAKHPGLYVYHCATPPPDMHIANGMYGMVLVEPPGGLSAVDREFYFMQGEFYTNGAKGMTGNHEFSTTKMMTGIPDYVVFNGRVGALTGKGALSVQTGQKVRIFFGVGGPNLDSSFHIIGEIFDNVYLYGSVDPTALIRDVQTVSVPPGGSTIVEFTPIVPSSQAWGSYTIVDHSLSWAIQKGAAGTLTVSGNVPPGVFGS